MAIELVIFDCDGVLVDSEPVVNAVESAYFATLGFTIDPLEARRRFQGLTVEGVAQAVEIAIGRSLSAEELYAWGMTTALGLVEELRPIAGVADLIADVRNRGIATCVASQSPLPRVRLSLAVAGFGDVFDGRIFTASMVARPKPAPDLFLYAAEQMGADPSATVVIEDSPSGVAAARAAGMQVLGYADPRGVGAEPLRAAGARIATTMGAIGELIEALRVTE